jgi:acyl-CoA thioesterase-1
MNFRTALPRRLAGVCLAAALAIAAAMSGGSAVAKTIKVFALGASNTNGKGVGYDEAWPAQLERMLRAKGYDATVKVNALNGDTSAGILGRASSIPEGTQVVVFDTGGDNDRLRGTSQAETAANRGRIESAIRAHHAVPIWAPYKTIIGPQRSGGSGYQADGIHLTAQSHARMAAYLVPKVIAAAK